eukprot:CAMPEP_0185470942 /NCGR_PEP_ID=MMETSP1365-20130426/98984_1 /TAXON_ID=38817 /ORGANISM="Gephyrocapsa oceanica, Strain RCC1303" /LENGTH=277 /DNA_ID=CAMNT_0028077681 /DNA_START=117 /DNA_END=946 /DNA_ORIENTATION=-
MGLVTRGPTPRGPPVAQPLVQRAGAWRAAAVHTQRGLSRALGSLRGRLGGARGAAGSPCRPPLGSRGLLLLPLLSLLLLALALTLFVRFALDLLLCVRHQPRDQRLLAPLFAEADELAGAAQLRLGQLRQVDLVLIVALAVLVLAPRLLALLALLALVLLALLLFGVRPPVVHPLVVLDDSKVERGASAVIVRAEEHDVTLDARLKRVGWERVLVERPLCAAAGDRLRAEEAKSTDDGGRAAEELAHLAVVNLGLVAAAVGAQHDDSDGLGRSRHHG